MATGATKLPRVDGIDHFDLVASDAERSLDFYRGLLRPLGYVREGVIVGERGERVTYLNRVAGGSSFSIRQSQSDGRPAPYDRYAVGLHHIAFTASSRGVVDERAGWLAQQGAVLESGPREYHYAPGYYAVFFYDPDQIKLELVHNPQDRDLVTHVQQLARRVAELEGGQRAENS